MAVAFEKIMDDLIRGATSLDAACRVLADEVRGDAQRTRFWPQHIQTELARGRISACTARALLDALENFGADRTLWLSSDALEPQCGTPVSAPASGSRALDSVEAMRAMLFDGVARANSAPPSFADLPAPTPAETAELEQEQPIGSILTARYALTHALGLAGVGRFYRAVDRDSREQRAVTIQLVAGNLRGRPRALEALQRAVVRSQSLEHPNVASLCDIDRDGDRVFIVMEDLQGRWLSQLIREVRGRGLSHDAAWPIVAGIAQGLAHAHGRGVVHGDLNPHSVFLGVDGVPKIVNFGLAHAIPDNEALDVLDTQTLRAYSEAYSTEASNEPSEAHAADDLYPLGVIAYELLTGAHPFQRNSLAEARRKNLRCTPAPGVHRRARKLIEHCLSFERERRPEDAEAFVRRMRGSVLERFLPGAA